MKKLFLIFAAAVVLSSVAFAQASARSGFIDGFDESKYKETTVSEDKKDFEEVSKNNSRDKIKEFDGQRFKIKCHFRYFNDFDGEFAFYSDGERFSIPMSGDVPFSDDMPHFTPLEIYYHHEASKSGKEWWYRNNIDGWRVLDDIRFVGQKYIVTDALRIRKSPSLSAEQVGRLSKDERATVIEVGEDVTIDGIESAWVKVRTKDGAEGWCFAGYLTDGTEYRVPLWKSTVKIGAYEKRKFVEILCAFDWYIPGVDDSIVYRFYTKDGNLYLNEYCYDVHDDVSLKLEYKGGAVEIVEREGKLLCECDEIRLSAYLGKEVALYDGKLRVTLYHSFDDEPYLYAFDLYEYGKGEE